MEGHPFFQLDPDAQATFGKLVELVHKESASGKKLVLRSIIGRLSRMTPEELSSSVEKYHGAGLVTEYPSADTAINAAAEQQPGEASPGLARIVQLIQMVRNGTPPSKTHAAKLLAGFATEGPAQQAMISSAGGVDALVHLVQDGPATGRKEAACALGHLSAHSPENRVAISERGGIPALVRVLKNDSRQARCYAAHALGHLALRSPQNQGIIARAGGIAPLVRLIKEVDSEDGISAAAIALACLAAHNTENKTAAVLAGAVPPLIHKLNHHDIAQRSQRHAANVLGHLATVAEGQEAIVQEGGVVALVRAAKSGGSDCKKYAAKALASIADSCSEHQAAIVNASGIQVLIELATDGPAEAQQYASRALWSLGSAHAREHQAALGHALGVGEKGRAIQSAASAITAAQLGLGSHIYDSARPWHEPMLIPPRGRVRGVLCV